MMAEPSVPYERGREDVDKFRELDLVKGLNAAQFCSFSADGEGSRSLEEEKKSLLELISISRTTEGRAKLAELRVIDLLMSWLRQFRRRDENHRLSNPKPFPAPAPEVLDKLLLVLKLIRNICAGDSTNQDAFLKLGGTGTLASIAIELLHSGHSGSEDFDGLLSNDSALERITARFESSSISCTKNPNSAFPPVGCFQMMLQLLGNFAQCGEVCQAAVWESFFPFHFLELAALRAEEICGPLCMILYTCCQRNSVRCWQLCQGNGGALIAIVIAASMDNSDDAPGSNVTSSGSEQINWLGLLVQHLCLREPLFPLLFVNLGVRPLQRVVDPINANTDEVVSVCQLCLESSTFTSLQAGLLFILCDCLSSQASDEENDGGPPMPLKSMCFMVGILRMAAQGVVRDSGLSPVPTLTSASCTVRILGFVLSIWRMSFAWDSKDGDRTGLTKFLLSHGVVELLLSLLEALGPPEAPGRGETGGMALEDGLPHGVGEFPRKNPYLGYRRDIVAVIANLSHQNSLLQDFVREKGGLLLVLQQCVVERENPFLREWGLWAMRNLLEGNEQNQAEISQLEVQESVNLPELERMGLNVQIDPKTRRPRLVNESASSLQP